MSKLTNSVKSRLDWGEFVWSGRSIRSPEKGSVSGMKNAQNEQSL